MTHQAATPGAPTFIGTPDAAEQGSPAGDAGRLLWRDRDVIRALSIGARTLDRLLSSGRFLQADLRIGRARRWKPETVRAWIEAEARRQASKGAPDEYRPRQ
jgi:hypothetical protein